MRLVLDTNVIVSAAFWGGVARQVLETAQCDHTLCFTEETLAELERVLRYSKFAERLEKLDFTVTEFIERLTERAIVLPAPTRTIDVVKADPDDNKFLSCAAAARAEAIVSGDTHLLELKTFKGIGIVSPHIFLSKKKE